MLTNNRIKVTGVYTKTFFKVLAELLTLPGLYILFAILVALVTTTIVSMAGCSLDNPVGVAPAPVTCPKGLAYSGIVYALVGNPILHIFFVIIPIMLIILSPIILLCCSIISIVVVMLVLKSNTEARFPIISRLIIKVINS